MPLPTIPTPTYELTLPSNGKKIKYRPFLVPEEKIFLLTLEGLSDKAEDELQNKKNIMLSIRQVINNCVLEPKDFEIESLPVFDLEYIFVQLRAKSINDKLDLYFEGNKDLECEECRKSKHIEVDLNTVKVKRKKEHSNQVKITDDLIVTMKYPSFSLYTELETNTKLSDLMFDFIVECIENICDKDEVYEAKDYKKEELRAFVDSMSKKQYLKIKDFFDTMPRLEHRIEWECPKCKKKHHYDLTEIEDFFA
jgi:hypothetical protein